MADSRRRQIQAAIPLVATLCMIAGAVDVIAYHPVRQNLYREYDRQHGAVCRVCRGA